MVVDTSAIIAVIFDEPEGERLWRVILNAPMVVLSAVNYYEALIVIGSRKSVDGQTRLRDLITTTMAEVVPLTPELAFEAHIAYMEFGKGIHPAKLNMGDCAAYALATRLDLPLLYKGDDFAQTPVRAVEY